MAPGMVASCVAETHVEPSAARGAQWSEPCRQVLGQGPGRPLDELRGGFLEKVGLHPGLGSCIGYGWMLAGSCLFRWERTGFGDKITRVSWSQFYRL